MGLQRRRREAVYQYIERATGPWTACPVGQTAREKAAPPKTQVQEVASEQPGVRIFVVQSDERLAYERAQRVQAMARVRAQLEALERRVATGKLTDAAKIGAAAARILTHWHGSRHYTRASTSSRRRSRSSPPWRWCRSTRSSNARDATTVPQVLEDLEQRFGLARVRAAARGWPR